MIQSNAFKDIYYSLLFFFMDADNNERLEVAPRGEPTIELLNWSFKLTDPTNNYVLSKSRNVDYDYANALKEYTVGGGKNLDQLEKLRPGVSKYVESGEFHVNYGERIDRQYCHAKEELIIDPDTRRAVIVIIDSVDVALLSEEMELEFPCCESIQFFIRNNKLECTVVMRSQNVCAILPYDVYCFTALQIKLASELGLPLGSYTHYMKSAHIYKRDCKLVNDILDEYPL